MRRQRQADKVNTAKSATASLKGESMKKLISFKVLKSICAYEFDSVCEHKDGGDLKCNSKNCPAWKKLKGERNG